VALRQEQALKQQERGGNYVGLCTYENGGYREVITVELTESLVPGDKYLAKMYVSKADNAEYATNNLGMYFSDAPIQAPIANVAAQLKAPFIITNISSWEEVFDTLVFGSTHKYLTIGNFDNNTNTNILQQNPSGGTYDIGYYYIEDVSVIRLTYDYSVPIITICEGDSAKLHASFDGFTHWECDSLPGTIVSTDTTIWVSPDSSLGYWAVGTIDSSYTLINVVNPPAVNLGVDTTICSNSHILFNLTSPDYDVVWEDGSTTEIYSSPDSGYLWVDVTNECFTTRDSIHISYLPDLEISIGSDTIICVGDSIELSADQVYDNYYWTDDDSLSSLWVDTTGLYILVVEYDCGFASDYKWVYLDSMPALQLSADTTLCFGSQFSIFDSINSYQGYAWQDGNTDSIYMADTAGTYWLDVTHRCGIDSDTMVIDYFNVVDIVLGADTSICVGDSLMLELPQTTGTILWSTGSIDTSFTVFTEGLYWAEIIENGCVYTDSIFIDTINIPAVYIDGDTSFCAGDSIPLFAIINGASSFVWSTGSAASSIMIDTAGLYYMTATNICGASYDNINVIEKPLPTFSLGVDTSFCLGEFIFIIAPDSAGTIVWDNGSTYYSRQIKEDGNYWATANAQGCSYSDTIYVDTTLCEILLELPNVFTPNEDSENDVFKAVELAGIDNLNIQIFNRWGQLVYLSNSKHFAWDGRNFADEQVPTGSYFYIIEYNDVLGTEKSIKGNVAVFK
jgi:gliding motility-associated-like protein